ncbi:MAG: alpha/beta hydrolase-fold protein [Alphaproteobacteria bacterium]
MGYMRPASPRAIRTAASALLLAGLGAGPAAEAADGDGDFVIAPPYAPAPQVVPDYEVPQGTIYEFAMDSADSAIFPVDVLTGETFLRAVAVYVPAQYQPGSAAPFMVVQDGVSFYQGTMVPVLDNMIAAGTLPALVAIFVEPGPNGGATEGQRSFEYDSVSEAYVTFVETELLPRVERETGATLTDDPEGRAAMGGSSGGAAAFTMGWFRPDGFRRILTYSGSFVALQSNAAYPDGAWTYHARLIGESPAKPLHVALAASEYDFDMNDEGERRRNWVEANAAMAAALAAQGYRYRYVFARGADHVDWAVMEQTLPETLAWLWQGYPRP